MESESARTIPGVQAFAQGHNVLQARTSYERRACSPGKQWFLGVWLALWSMLGISGSYIKGGFVQWWWHVYEQFGEMGLEKRNCWC